jgi:RND family efflux transporter MFP subunit
MRTRSKALLIGGFILAVIVVLMFRNRAAMNAPTSTSAVITTHSIAVAKAVRQPLDDSFSVVGTVHAFNDVTILSETSGRVVKVLAEVGEHKKAGAVLVEVDSELKVAAYKTAEVAYEKAKKDVARYEALYKEGSIPDAQIEQARWTFQSAEAQFIVARRQLADTRITTPIAGVVTARFVNLGTMVMGAPQATPIANVVDLSRLKVKINVAERDVFKLHPGDAVEVATDVFPELVFSGSVFTVSSKGDDAHTYGVEVLLKDPCQRLKAGMFARATFRPKSSGSAVQIPRRAIVGSIQDPKVFVVKGGTARLLPVVVTREAGMMVALAQGVEEGDSVVVDGQNNLTDSVAVVVRQQ